MQGDQRVSAVEPARNAKGCEDSVPVLWSPSRGHEDSVPVLWSPSGMQGDVKTACQCCGACQECKGM